MRVVITTESYLPYLSGVTVSTDALARGLGARGHDVLVLAPRPAAGRVPGTAGSPGPEPRLAWLPSYELPAVAPPGYRLPLPLPSASVAAAVDFRPDIVHAQSPFVSGVLARRLARRVRAPLVFTHHTRFDQYRHYLGPLAGPGRHLTDAYLRRFWLGCAAIVTPSADLAAEIEARLGPRRRWLPVVRAIPTGVDTGAIRALPRPNIRSLAGWPAGTVVAATLGRLAPEKSVDVVLEAVAEAARTAPDLRLLVVGGGPSEAELRERAERADLAGRVHFAGARGRLEALAHLRGCDLFAFASTTETQGLVLAEALACGLPVVARAAPGVADSVRHGVDGVIVDDAADLGPAIASLARDAVSRRAMAESAVQDVHRFDLTQRIGEVEALYTELLEAAPKARAG